MEFRRTRLVDFVVAVTAVLSAVEICNTVSMPLSRSMATGLLFVTSFLGIQRIYSAVVDILIILSQPVSHRGKHAV